MNSSYLQHITSNKEQSNKTQEQLIKEQLIKEQLIKEQLNKEQEQLNKEQEQLNKIQEYNKKYIELENKYVNSSHFIRTIFYFFAVFFLLMLFQYNLQEKMTYCIKSKDLQHELYNTKIEPKQIIVPKQTTKSKQTIVKIIRI